MQQNNILLRNSVDYVYICSGDPQTYTEAVAQKLAEKAINFWSFTGPFQGSHDPLGQKVILTAFTTTAATAGSGQHLAFVNTTTSVLWRSLARTFSKELYPGETIEVPATNLEEGFPTQVT